MYDELFDVLYEACLTEDAGGARGKYVQLQKEKLKKLEEEKKSLIERKNNATRDTKYMYVNKIKEIDAKIDKCEDDIDKYDEFYDKYYPVNNRVALRHNQKQKARFAMDHHDWRPSGDNTSSVNGKINRRAEAEAKK